MTRHILFVAIAAYGHVLPTRDVVAELVGRGHRVSYVTGDGQPAATVEAAGARVTRYASHLGTVDLAEIGQIRNWPRALVVNLRESEAVLAAVGDRPAPDLLVYDGGVYHAGRVLARRWGIPSAMSSPVLMSNGHYSVKDAMFAAAGARQPGRHPVLRQFMLGLNRMLVAHGHSDVSVLDFMNERAELNLAFFPRSFQPREETFGADTVFVGPAGADPPGDSWRPPADGRPVLLMSLGTSHHPRPEFFRTCLDAFAAMDWHVVLVTSGAVDAPALGAVPPNVELHRWVRLPDVLRHARVFLCHGGMGSVMSGLRAGVPIVAVPHSGEAMVNGLRVTELGLGRVLDPATLTAPSLRAAVEEAAADPATGPRLAAMRHDIETAGGGPRAADAVEALLPLGAIA